MGFKLESVIPWGRSMEEYVKMFDLTPEELKLNILDCASGPASFNAEMTLQGYKVISCDPVYQFTANEINKRIQDTYETVIQGVKANQEHYIWQTIQSPEQMGVIRMAAMRHFLADFSIGIIEKRYVQYELPVLPFAKNQFDLALCSHLLFTYSDHLSQEFHLASILEMCRVAKEVRIFPLLNISGETSPWLKPVMNELQKRGYSVEIKQVAYEFQKNGNQILRII
ncbi:SAM-dependent methyltransferase [Nostocaceae cyanobacterium CENA357]|uniref:SAM-dependent methyltransferase n=1 Tax=Atlanticothrix silvestris CENA357 TaxID=1725252 RepID=A0A8J7HHN9_9CYAN|nr:SAM-dependent methyltransferase [Atlanticothrix silvestris]MBH8555447.1 SAM-dependent methyltransferase [Atlanticothrix silvestris CENA357]